jgi:hypothetical protein
MPDKSGNYNFRLAKLLRHWIPWSSQRMTPRSGINRAERVDGVQRLAVACSSPDRTGFSLHSNKLLHSVATEIGRKEARSKM